MIIALVATSILTALADRWLQLLNVGWFALTPGAVLSGQIWRLFTYAWVEWSPLGLLIDVLILGMFGRQMEERWGTRIFVRRVLALIVVPAVLTSLLALVAGQLQGLLYLGMRPLVVGLIVAFASQLRHAQVRLILIPIPFSGDGLLVLSGALLGLSVLFSGSILPFMPEIFAFAIALAWFRFDLLKDVRRTWLRFRKKQIEARMAKMRRDRSGLRVVRDEDDDSDSKRFLH